MDIIERYEKRISPSEIKSYEVSSAIRNYYEKEDSQSCKRLASAMMSCLAELPMFDTRRYDAEELVNKRLDRLCQEIDEEVRQIEKRRIDIRKAIGPVQEFYRRSVSYKV